MGRQPTHTTAGILFCRRTRLVGAWLALWWQSTCPSTHPRASRPRASRPRVSSLGTSSSLERLLSRLWPLLQLATLPPLPLALPFARASPCAAPSRLQETAKSARKRVGIVHRLTRANATHRHGCHRQEAQRSRTGKTVGRQELPCESVRMAGPRVGGALLLRPDGACAHRGQAQGAWRARARLAGTIGPFATWAQAGQTRATPLWAPRLSLRA